MLATRDGRYFTKAAVERMFVISTPFQLEDWEELYNVLIFAVIYTFCARKILHIEPRAGYLHKKGGWEKVRWWAMLRTGFDENDNARNSHRYYQIFVSLVMDLTEMMFKTFWKTFGELSKSCSMKTSVFVSLLHCAIVRLQSFPGRTSIKDTLLLARRLTEDLERRARREADLIIGSV